MKMNKFILLFLLFPLLLANTKCQTQYGNKYLPPEVEECIVITQWDEKLDTDTGTCFCIDKKIKDKASFKAFYDKSLSYFNQHPLRDAVSKYLLANQKLITEKHEYELPISYCRGYVSVSTDVRGALETWAETNRVERIKCEAGVK